MRQKWVVFDEETGEVVFRTFTSDAERAIQQARSYLIDMSGSHVRAMRAEPEQRGKAEPGAE